MLAQLAVGWIMYVFNFVVFLIFFVDADLSIAADEKTNKNIQQNDEDVAEGTDINPKSAKTIWNRNYSRWESREWRLVLFGTIIYISVVTFLVLITATFMVLFGIVDARTTLLAEVIGYVASVVVVIQWSPQIYRTIKFKSSGSFSIVMILMFVPGCFTIMFFMAVIEKESFSLWISYLLSGIQMVILLCLLIWYDYIKPKLFKGYQVEDAEEKSALVKEDAIKYGETLEK